LFIFFLSLVLNSTNHKVPCDVICSSEDDSNDCTIFFTAKLPHQAFTYFKITQADDPYAESNLVMGSTVEFDELAENEDPLISQSSKSYKFPNGRNIKIYQDLHEMVYNDGRNEYKFSLNYNHYRSYPGPDKPSGAYIFRPDNYTINGSLLYNIPIFSKTFYGNNLIQISVRT